MILEMRGGILEIKEDKRNARGNYKGKGGIRSARGKSRGKGG